MSSDFDPKISLDDMARMEEMIGEPSGKPKIEAAIRKVMQSMKPRKPITMSTNKTRAKRKAERQNRRRGR